MHDTVILEPKSGTQVQTDAAEATSRAEGINAPVMGTPMPYLIHASAHPYNSDGSYPHASDNSSAAYYGMHYAPESMYREAAAQQMYPYGPNIPPQVLLQS